jgi:hypothetical protein
VKGVTERDSDRFIFTLEPVLTCVFMFRAVPGVHGRFWLARGVLAGSLCCQAQDTAGDAGRRAWPGWRLPVSRTNCRRRSRANLAGNVSTFGHTDSSAPTWPACQRPEFVVDAGYVDASLFPWSS